MTSIFEEIENLLMHNECLGNEPEVVAPPSPDSASLDVKPARGKKTSAAHTVGGSLTGGTGINKLTAHLPLDFLPPCVENGFLVPEDTNTLPEELYTVSHNELEPINSPFMVPGIYKKISTAATEPTKATSCGNPEASNVYLSGRKACGRIVPRNDFKNGVQMAQDPEETKGCKSSFVDNTKSNEMRNFQWQVLSKLASSIYKYSESDHIVIDRKRNEVIRTHATTNQKTIYRFLATESLNLQLKAAQSKGSLACSRNNHVSHKPKLGRPKKRPVVHASQSSEDSVKKPKQEESAFEIQNYKMKPDSSINNSTPQLRSRSGRVVKLIKPLPKTVTAKDADNPAKVKPVQMSSILNELKDTDFYYNEPTKLTVPSDENKIPLKDAISPTKRHVPPESICPTCGKIFLGRRLQRHFAQNPDHMRPIVTKSTMVASPPPPPTPFSNNEITQDHANEEMTLFRFLVGKIQKANLNEDQRADLFLNELNDLVEQLQLRSSRLIRNTSGLHFVSARTARVLGIPEGQYALDMSAIEAPPELENNYMSTSYDPKLIPPVATVSTRSLDYTALSLDDTLTDEAAQKLNLTAGGKILPPSEESLLRAVDDLVPNGVTKLVEASLMHPPTNAGQSTSVAGMVPHYDHVSDNAMEAMTIKDASAAQQETPIMGLAVDFFRFKNN